MSDLTFHALFARDLARLDIALPEQAQRVLDIHQAALTAASAQPADTLLAGLRDGSLTADNVADRVFAAATQQLAREKAHELLRNMSHPMGKVFSQAIRDEADRLLRDLRKVFTASAKIVQRAGVLFPVAATGEDVLRAGADDAAAWSELRAARERLDVVHAVRATLARDYRVEPVETEVLAYTKGINSALGEQAAHGAWTGHADHAGGRWHALTAAGFTLHLASAADIAKAQDAIPTARQSEVDADREASIAQQHEANRGWLFPTMPARVPAA